MTSKRPILTNRIRRIPSQFSWIDQRLIRDHYVELCDHETLALYLFLVTVADADGLSYYGDQRLCQCLNMDTSALARARDWLVRLQLIAYQAPLYQVLALEGDHD